VESVQANNHYIRQGADTEQVWKNINWLLTQQTDRFSVVLRTVPQLFNVNNYDQLIRYAYDHRVAIQSNPLVQPLYLTISVLPWEIRRSLLPKYQQLKDYLNNRTLDISTIATGRDVSNIELMLTRETETIISLLESAEPNNAEQLRQELISWMIRWDREFKLNALEFYPEFADFFIQYGYKI
jgi:hypothetical protein